jgi:hypothetical protein
MAPGVYDTVGAKLGEAGENQSGGSRNSMMVWTIPVGNHGRVSTKRHCLRKLLESASKIARYFLTVGTTVSELLRLRLCS